MNDWEYETELVKFKRDYVFILEHAIRNDDSAKDRLTKINALAYHLNKICQRFINEAMLNKESRVVISYIETQRNLAARDLYKRYLLKK